MNQVTPTAVQVDLLIPTIHPMPLIDTGEQGSDCALSVGYVRSIYYWNDDTLRHIRENLARSKNSGITSFVLIYRSL